MAISGGKTRRSITLGDITWAELDAEVEETSLTISEVMQRYITEGRLTSEERQSQQMEQLSQQVERGLGQLRDEVRAVITVIDVWVSQQQDAPQEAVVIAPVSSEAEQRQTLLNDWYAANKWKRELEQANAEPEPVYEAPKMGWMRSLWRWLIYAPTGRTTGLRGR